LSEKSSLKASISVTGKKNAKNASTGPNKFSKQCLYAPEIPVEATVFVTFGSGKKNMIVAAGAKAMYRLAYLCCYNL